MPFTEHLAELRKRILISLGFLLFFFVLSFNYSEHIFSLLLLPMKKTVTIIKEPPYIVLTPTNIKNQNLVFLGPAEAFWMHLKISFISGLIISLPVVFYQLWKFVSPGLLPKERKYLLPFVVSASGLFFVGASFCFIIVLPFAMNFLLTYKTEHLIPMISVGKYVDFCLKFILAFGAIFELPLIILFLSRMGIVRPETLARHRKYAILGAFVIAAILTPTPDAFNQTLMAVPIVLLYEVGIIISRLFVRRKNG
ncbi:MAG: twin-arginine translocase subunit TatC [Thermodesulfovibrionales bacterium]|nr:twin-arginine translocase subunit TatC [Thermodesulfovibrionales bacterium]